MKAASTYRMAPLIRGTLVLLYLALVLPLAPLAPVELRLPLAVALPLGLLLVLAISSEQVVLDDDGIAVGHPAWCRWLVRRGWQLPWSEIRSITPVATSQGGRVFYLRAADGSAWLLPQRVERFDEFLQRFSGHSGLDTAAIGRISPPWTYQLLAILAALMVSAELIVGLVLWSQGQGSI
jgi:hypothetical protein